MDVRLLRKFLVVADEGSFSRAAERLFIAQPALSRSIHQLEEEIGTALLDRGSRPLRLTSTGTILYDHARSVIDRMQELEATMKAAAKDKRQRITISIAKSTVYSSSPKLFEEFRRQAGDTELLVVEHTTQEQMVALKEGRINIGVNRVRLENDPAIRQITLGHEKLVAAIAHSHPLARQSGRLALGDLADEPLIVYPNQPGPSHADNIVAIFHDRGFKPIVAHAAPAFQIAISLVAANEGVTIVPESFRAAQIPDVVYCELIEPVTSPLVMSYRIGDASPGVAMIASIILQTVTDLTTADAAALREDFAPQ